MRYFFGLALSANPCDFSNFAVAQEILGKLAKIHQKLQMKQVTPKELQSPKNPRKPRMGTLVRVWAPLCTADPPTHAKMRENVNYNLTEGRTDERHQTL